ncbi:MAG: hypothetical protein K2Q22_06560, partial [Cytophagales bacterium]|nr:hypothetical protein [Cytophagales bacterium]
MKILNSLLKISFCFLIYLQSNAQSINFDNPVGNTLVIDNTRTFPIGGTLTIPTSSSGINIDVPIIISGADVSKQICAVVYFQDALNPNLTQILNNGRFTGFQNGNNQRFTFSINTGSDYINASTRINGGKLYMCLMNNDGCFSATTTTGCVNNILISNNVTFTGSVIIAPSTSTSSPTPVVNPITNADFGTEINIGPKLSIGGGYSYCQKSGNKPPIIYFPKGDLRKSKCTWVNVVLGTIEIYPIVDLQISYDNINWTSLDISQNNHYPLVFNNLNYNQKTTSSITSNGIEQYFTSIYWSPNIILNRTAYFRLVQTYWNCQGIKNPYFYDGYNGIEVSNILTIKVYDSSPNELIPINPTNSALNCVNYGNQYTVPNYPNSNYLWQIQSPTVNLKSDQLNQLRQLLNMQTMPGYRFDLSYPFQLSYPTNISITAAGVCQGQTLTNSYTQQFSKPSIPSFLPTFAVTPVCNSSSSIYVTHLPYLDGTSSFTLTVPSGKGWQIKNYPGSIVTIPENTNIELQQNGAILSESSFQIPVQVNYSCGTPTTSLLGAITVGGYTPLAGKTLTASKNNACISDVVTFNMNAYTDIFSYQWNVNGYNASGCYYTQWYPGTFACQSDVSTINVPQGYQLQKFNLGKNIVSVDVYPKCSNKIKTFTTTV